MRSRLLLGAIAVAVAIPARSGGPSGPFPDCAEDRRDACPNDLSWTDTSWIPESSRDTVREVELGLGSGVSLDRALRHTAGRWDVTVAVIDSGIDWSDTQLGDKVLLNLSELPVPQLANGADADGYDVDGNGIVNLRDYRLDPRVDIAAGVDLADDRLDPSDLIATFSDGVDDDGNGYVDDIAGWDFFEHDNDPYASFLDGFWDHGSGVAKTAVAWANDGGELGGCPDCSLLPVRIGEAFVADGDRLALAIGYAADRGASSASMAVGGLTHPGALDRVARYADDKGLVLVGAGGDENTWHRNQPAGAGPFLFVKSVRALDRKEKGGAYSFFATWNCNNFGPRMDLVAPATECATGATARIAGLAGLVKAAGREQGEELHPARIRSLLRATADDVALTEAEQDRASALPSSPGWDAFHGYGRANVGAAVDAIYAGKAPPRVQILSPSWFSWDTGEEVVVEGVVEGDGTSWTLERGFGAEPDAWEQVASGSGPISGRLASVSRAGAREGHRVPLERDDTVLDRFRVAHEGLVQLRLRGTGASGAVGEDRSAYWVTTDEDLLEGWPVRLDGGTSAAVNLADLDGDGDFEVLIAEAGGRVRVLQEDGSSLEGWPVQTGTHPESPKGAAAWTELGPLLEGIASLPAVGDLDGDGEPEVVVTTTAGGVYAWTAGGEVVDGYPLEVCHPENCGKKGARIVAPPALGDVDGDGDLDAVVPTGEVPPGRAGVVFLVDLRAARIDGLITLPGLFNDTLLPVIGEGHPAPSTLVDIDDDGDLELMTAPMLSAGDLLHHDGEVALDLGYSGDDHGALATYIEATSVQMTHAPAVGDLDGDGVEDLVVGGASATYILSLALTRYTDHQHGMFAWSGATGLSLPGFPQQTDSVSFLAAPAIADITGDGVPEVLMATSGHRLFAVDGQGRLAEGFPKLYGGWAAGGPSVGDIDGDGFLDVLITTRDGLVFAWRTEGLADGPTPWPRPRRDAANTGNAETVMLPQRGPRKCGCDAAGGGAWALWLVGMAVVLGRRRR